MSTPGVQAAREESEKAKHKVDEIRAQVEQREVWSPAAGVSAAQLSHAS